MGFFKKTAAKVAADVKEAVVEETGKTVEEIKDNAKKTFRDILPTLLAVAAVVAVVAILRRPAPTVVKIVIKTAV